MLSSRPYLCQRKKSCDHGLRLSGQRGLKEQERFKVPLGDIIVCCIHSRGFIFLVLTSTSSHLRACRQGHTLVATIGSHLSLDQAARPSRLIRRAEPDIIHHRRGRGIKDIALSTRKTSILGIHHRYSRFELPAIQRRYRCRTFPLSSAFLDTPTVPTTRAIKMRMS